MFLKKILSFLRIFSTFLFFEYLREKYGIKDIVDISLCDGKREGGGELGRGSWRSCSCTKAFKTYETLNDLHTCRKKILKCKRRRQSKKETAQWHKAVAD